MKRHSSTAGVSGAPFGRSASTRWRQALVLPGAVLLASGLTNLPVRAQEKTSPPGPTNVVAAPVPAPVASPRPAPAPARADQPPLRPPVLQQRALAPASPVSAASTSPAAAGTPAPVAGPPVPAAGAKPMLQGPIEFQGAPISAVLDFYARLTNRSIISAANLPGMVYFRSQTELSKEEAIQALDSVLAINGIATVPMGDKFLKVVQIATAKQEGVSVGVQDLRAAPAGDTLVTQIVPLKFIDVAEMVPALQPYMHAYGQMVPLTKSNSILITDTGGNINQMLEIIKYVDQPSPLRMVTRVYVIRNAKAADIVQQLDTIIQQTQQLGARPTTTAPGQPPQPVMPRFPGRPVPAATASAGSTEESLIDGKVVITSDERTNKMLISSRPSNFEFFEKIIAELDGKVEPDVITKVIPMSYAQAEDMAALLNSIVTGGTMTTVHRTGSSTSTPGGRSSSTPAPPPMPVSAPSGAAGVEGAGFLQYPAGVRILPDPRTNSLLVMATKEDMERIELLIQKVDTAVAQVLIEVVIGEVTLDDTLEAGVNLMKRLTQGGSINSLGGTSTGGNTPGPLDLTGATPGSGLPSGVALSSALTYFATFKGLKLDAAVQLLASTSNFRVLSTPIIMTLHNQEANIIVGESVPIITATIAGVSTVSVSNQVANALQSNVEYKDVAIELKVTPRINPDGYVTMDIDQKVNDLGANVNIQGTAQPIITKREAKSSVSVKDQSTVVLGGLIKEQKGVTETKVPFLGDIPFLGHLFKNKVNTKTRTELIVFIRPTVLRTDAQAVAEAHRRSHMLKAGHQVGLDKLFPDSEELGTNVPPSITGVDRTSAPAAPESPERRAAKVKALQDQNEGTPP